MATRKTPAKTAPGGGPVKVADLPDMGTAQLAEASLEPTTFVLGDGTKVKFRPITEWSFRANQAMVVGDLVTWMRGALVDEGDVETLMDRPGREVGRIVRYFDEQMGAMRGEGASSSES